VHAEVIVLLHGFIKKSRKTPPDDLDLAKKRTAEFLKAHNS
jgi:phage-related protein